MASGVRAPMSSPIGARRRPSRRCGLRAELGEQPVAPRRRAEQADIPDRAAVGERLEVGEVGVEVMAHHDGRIAVRERPAVARNSACGWQFSRQCGKRAASSSAGRWSQTVTANPSAMACCASGRASAPAPHNRSSGGGGKGMTSAAAVSSPAAERDESGNAPAAAASRAHAHRGGFGPGRIAAAGPPGAAGRGAVDDQRERAARARLDAGGDRRERLPVLARDRPAAAARASRLRSRCRCRTAGRPRRACRIPRGAQRRFRRPRAHARRGRPRGSRRTAARAARSPPRSASACRPCGRSSPRSRPGSRARTASPRAASSRKSRSSGASGVSSAWAMGKPIIG